MGFSTCLLKCLGDGQTSKWNGLFELVTNYCYDRSERQVTSVWKRLFTSESVRSISRNRRSKFTSEIDSWTVSCCHCWIDLENTVVFLLPVQTKFKLVCCESGDTDPLCLQCCVYVPSEVDRKDLEIVRSSSYEAVDNLISEKLWWTISTVWWTVSIYNLSLFQLWVYKNVIVTCVKGEFSVSNYTYIIN